MMNMFVTKRGDSGYVREKITHTMLLFISNTYITAYGFVCATNVTFSKHEGLLVSLLYN